MTCSIDFLFSRTNVPAEKERERERGVSGSPEGLRSAHWCQRWVRRSMYGGAAPLQGHLRSLLPSTWALLPQQQQQRGGGGGGRSSSSRAGGPRHLNPTRCACWWSSTSHHHRLPHPHRPPPVRDHAHIRPPRHHQLSCLATKQSSIAPAWTWRTYHHPSPTHAG